MCLLGVPRKIYHRGAEKMRYKILRFIQLGFLRAFVPLVFCIFN